MDKKLIRTKSYFPLTPDGEIKVCISDLENHQKGYIGSLLQTAFLNELYTGKYQFAADNMPPIDDVFPKILQT